MSELIVGIDLGTTNSSIAAIVDGAVKIVSVDGRTSMPSVVGLDSDGKLIVGQTAKNQLAAAPERTVRSIKRKMGGAEKVRLGDGEYSPEEISSFILRKLKQSAEQELGQTVSKAVITVPAFFNDLQRKATQDAGELAGLDVVRIINEPTAAALAYGADGSRDETLLVYDLGGGTFDVSLVVVENGVVEVKASHGDTHLGGDDFDDLLADHVMEVFNRDSKTDTANEAEIRRRFYTIVEPAKCQLTDRPDVTIREEYFLEDRHLEQEIERHRYEEIIQPLVQKTFECLHKTLTDASLTPADIDKVMLVGGASRTPLIHRAVQERLNLAPHSEIDPDLIVAMGAAVQAGIIAGDKPKAILVDITPHTYSTSTLRPEGFGLFCIPIVSRNTPLPTCKSEVFVTLHDQQESVRVEVFQGESQEPDENLLLGEFVIEGLSPVPAGNAVVLEYRLDLNGMLHVTATEKSTRLAKSVTIDTKGQHIIDLKEARKNIARLVDADPINVVESGTPTIQDDDSPEELLIAAKELRKRADALLKQKIAEDDANEIRALLEAVGTAVRSRDWSVLTQKNDVLSDLLFYLED